MRSARLLACVDVARPCVAMSHCRHLDLGVSWELGALGEDGWAVRTPEAARMLGVSRQTVVNMVERDWLRALVTAGGHRRVDRDSVEELKPLLELRGRERIIALEALAERNVAHRRRGEASPPNS